TPSAFNSRMVRIADSTSCISILSVSSNSRSVVAIAERPDMSDHEYGLVMPFFDDSPSFCHGFECGINWMAWRLGTYGECSIHSANIDQHRRMATHFDLAFDVVSDDGEWAVITVSRTPRLTAVPPR